MKLVIEDLPDAVYEHLESTAKLNGRSLNEEVLLRMADGFDPPRDYAAELEEIDAFRESLGRSFDHTLVDQFIAEGRR